MFGKKQKPESIAKNRESNLGSLEERYGKEKADEMKRKNSIKNTGENNPMAGRSIYDVWLEKGGKEFANKRMKEFKENKRNKIRIRNEKNEVKNIDPNELEKYILEGWTKGGKKGLIRRKCSNETKLLQSNKRKEYWKFKKQNEI